MIIIITILAYFCVLLLFSHITARRTSSNETFYRANRRSHGIWWLSEWWAPLSRASPS